MNRTCLRILKIIAPVLLLVWQQPSGYSQTLLTLEKALEIAELNSPDIRHSRLNLERYEETLNAQYASYKSKLALSITPLYYSHDREFYEFYSTWNTSETFRSSGAFTISQPIKLTDGILTISDRFSFQNSYSEFSDETNRAFSNNLYIQFDQPLFTYNRAKMQLDELELDYENAALSYAIQKMAIERNVTQSFYNVFDYQMSLQIAEEEYVNQQISYDIIKNKVDGGLSAMEELYQAELNLMTSKSNLQNQQVALENAKDAFKQLIGVSLYEEIAVLADVSVPEVTVDMQKAIDHALKNRMELRQREITIENSQFELIRTDAMNEFKGNVSVALGLFGDDKKLQNIYSSPTDNQQVSVSFQIPIWDWGEKKARLKAVEAAMQSQELYLEDENNNIIINIRSIYRNLQNLLTQIEIADQNRKNAELTYEINLERYRNGDLTSMDLSLFQNQLSEKKMAYSRALISYKIELLNLKIQSLWDFVENKSIVPEEFDRSG
ncbi:MAG: TolC family protein [Bacteroidales bacterium]|nr:MAG: TolC family protein [Bacteroidales bacterium]